MEVCNGIELEIIAPDRVPLSTTVLDQVSIYSPASRQDEGINFHPGIASPDMSQSIDISIQQSFNHRPICGLKKKKKKRVNLR